MSPILILSIYFDIVCMMILKAVTVVSEGSMAVQELIYTLINMPKRAIQKAFRIQMEIMYLPVRLVNNFLRLIFKRKEGVENWDRSVKAVSGMEKHSACNKFVQVNSDEEPCHKSVQVNSDIEPESPFDKSVQVSFDSIEENPCDKSVQVAEEEFPSHKSVQTMFDSEQEFPCNVSVQTLDSEQEFPCDVSVQTPDSEQEFLSDKFVQTTSDSDCETPCEKYVQANTHFYKEKSINQNDCHSPEVIFTDDMDLRDYPPCRTAADYIKYSTVVRERTMKLIEELSNITDSVTPRNETEYALRSLQYLNAKKEEVNSELKSVSNDIKTTPVIIGTYCKTRLQDSNMKKNKNLKHPEKKSDLHQNTQKEETNLPEELHHGQLVLNLSIEVLTSLVDIITQEVIALKRRLTGTNNRMDEVLKSANSLYEEQSRLNERFSKLVGLSSKISDLQSKLDESNFKVLTEVTCDRDEMQRKLRALERLIKEEEEYLDDVSCESGYDEIETRLASQFSSLS